MLQLSLVAESGDYSTAVLLGLLIVVASLVVDPSSRTCGLNSCGSWVPLPSYSLPGCPYPIKSLALSKKQKKKQKNKHQLVALEPRPRSCGALLRVVVHPSCSMGVGSSWIRDQTLVFCIRRRILYH